MDYKTCENCGSRIFNYGCVNCDEMEYISMQEGYEPPRQQVKNLQQADVMRPLLANYEGNWTEDFSHENGNYMNMCIRCDQEFLGHKRRVICKKCFSNGA